MVTSSTSVASTRSPSGRPAAARAASASTAGGNAAGSANSARTAAKSGAATVRAPCSVTGSPQRARPLEPSGQHREFAGAVRAQQLALRAAQQPGGQLDDGPDD